MSAVGISSNRPPTRWTRSYPPLLLAVVALLVAALVLPSALNMPQSNPSTVLEYAPVPPDDEAPPETRGSMSAFGLGGTSTLALGGDPPPPPPPPPPDDGRGDRPMQKKCVGPPGKLLQTEDPMSPPCVPYFDGDNFGATYQGVTGDEITVLIYLDNGCPNRECAKNPSGPYRYDDLNEPPKPPCPKTWPNNNPNRDDCDFIWVRTARAFNRYFNERFQTYGRKVRYYAFVSSAETAAQRRADAADNWSTLRPFAVIDFATYSGFNEAYADAMAARGVLVFSQQTALPHSFYQRRAPFSWGFYPDVERWAASYTSYVCSEVAFHPVRRYGNPPGQAPQNGRERRLGLFYTTDSAEPGLQRFADLVKQGLRDCGATWHEEGNFPNSGFLIKASDTGQAQAEAVTRFQDADVTTVLYLGGVEGKFSQIAHAHAYYPEIVVAGDLRNDNNQTARTQQQTVWQNAWGTHLYLRVDRPAEAAAYRAYREANPNANAEEAPFAIEAYRDHFMLFQAIQVAGPRLIPETVEQGFQAIPEHSSDSPYVASCFFQPGDFTCVKDATRVWWDPQGQSPAASEPGCFRLVEGGWRYLPSRWPGVDAVFRPGDPCTGFESRFQIDPRTN